MVGRFGRGVPAAPQLTRDAYGLVTIRAGRDIALLARGCRLVPNNRIT
jgi:hypothetical protein